MTGAFITLEGVEGCGKSTQAARLRTRLEQSGRDVLLTREPGGPPVAEAIRAILLDPAHTGMEAVTELLLYEAARAEHVAKTIRPALERGAVVLCDRFADSTTAYQGAGRRLDGAAVRNLHNVATGGLRPDLTLVLDVAPGVGLQRARDKGPADRIERESLEFHTRVREGFMKLAEEEPNRVHVVDGTGTVGEVAAAVWAHVAQVLGIK